MESNVETKDWLMTTRGRCSCHPPLGTAAPTIASLQIKESHFRNLITAEDEKF